MKEKKQIPVFDANDAIQIEFCNHIHCNRDGAKYSMRRACNELKISEEGMTEDKKIALKKTGCLGYCGMGPNVRVTNIQTGNAQVYTNVKPLDVAAAIRNFKK